MFHPLLLLFWSYSWSLGEVKGSVRDLYLVVLQLM